MRASRRLFLWWQNVAKHGRDAVRHSVRLRRTPLHLAVLAALASPSMATLAQDAIWNGGTGNWDNTTQWSTGQIPGSTTDVRVDGGKTGTASLVNVVNANADARNLTIDAGDRVDINNSRQLTIHGASLLNNGTLSLSSTGTATTLRVGNTTFSGTGVISLGNNANNRIIGIAATNVLTNAAGHTIQGSGSITGVGLNNQGLIDANQSVPLTINLSGTAPTRSNSGTLQASNGGTLVLNATALTNAGGLVQALDGSVVQLGNNTVVSGGALATEGTGVIQVTSSAFSSSARLADATNQGRIEVQNARGLTIDGTLTNQGTLALASTGSSTYLHVADGQTATLAGTGELVIAGASQITTRSVSSSGLLQKF